ncbi:MAG: CopD family protein [Ferruginibacter sp.]
MYFYIKAIHIIFIVTWFSGMFYLPRLFIYNREAFDKTEPEKSILQKQFSTMIRRLWLGITWPSAILTLIFGTWIAIFIWLYPFLVMGEAGICCRFVHLSFFTPQNLQPADERNIQVQFSAIEDLE